MLKFTDVFYYDTSVGHLRNKGSVGRPKERLSAYFDKSSGYYRVKFMGKGFLEHRVIYEMFNGHFTHDLDHIDRNKLNNKIENLRTCSRPENVLNSRIRVDNKSGYKGVVWHKASGKWQAQTMLVGKRIHIGLFDNPKHAALAYNKVVKELHGDFPVLNNVMFFDDEKVSYVANGREEEIKKILKEAMEMANDKLKLNVPLGVDVKFGLDYSEVH